MNKYAQFVLRSIHHQLEYFLADISFVLIVLKCGLKPQLFAHVAAKNLTKFLKRRMKIKAQSKQFRFNKNKWNFMNKIILYATFVGVGTIKMCF